jgi:hypothetical protein
MDGNLWDEWALDFGRASLRLRLWKPAGREFRDIIGICARFEWLASICLETNSCFKTSGLSGKTHRLRERIPFRNGSSNLFIGSDPSDPREMSMVT